MNIVSWSDYSKILIWKPIFSLLYPLPRHPRNLLEVLKSSFLRKIITTPTLRFFWIMYSQSIYHVVANILMFRFVFIYINAVLLAFVDPFSSTDFRNFPKILTLMRNAEQETQSTVANPYNLTYSEYVDSLELYHKFTSCNDDSVRENLSHSLSIILNAIRLFGPDNVYGSFNGGKDAVLVLHLFR